jgi:hypothetical protein
LTNGNSVEIESPIDTPSFNLLLHDCGSSLRKLRDGVVLWDVDFFESEAKETHYFAMAEAKMPAGMVSPSNSSVAAEASVVRGPAP